MEPFVWYSHYMVAWFECTATIDDVLRGSIWYYISCGGCHSKATKGEKSLICTNKKCDRTEVTGVPEYMAKISVYDQSEQAVFVLLGDAGPDGVVPVPQALLETIGQTHRFIVKVSDYNLTGKIQSTTVTK
ncbi:unnamed protein product, partial [Eruca vesicaria subsp. sativa]|nr:unnamed protein product [Eruca vesicaria subsp. sativa]